jgi:regulator of PEP synthase PpsR (kinase-PPPase family)
MAIAHQYQDTLEFMAKKKSKAKKSTKPKSKTKKKKTGRKTSPDQDSAITLHIFSVAAGGLANQIVNAVMTQFPELKVDVRTHTYVDSVDKIRTLVRQIKGDNQWIFHALIEQELKQLVIQLCERHGIPNFDLTGGLIDFISENAGHKAADEVARLYQTDDGYFKRMDALEFSLQHDDSRRLETLQEADIILVGLSRVSKTPTSIYLGYMGFKVANVSVAPEVGIPKELRRSYRKKVVALTIQPKKLQEIRSRRMEVNKFDKALAASGSKQLGYVDIRSVIKEVMYAESLYRERGFAIVNITDQTIEATALTVLEALDLSRPLY